jgi:hypothetical protein
MEDYHFDSNFKENETLDPIWNSGFFFEFFWQLDKKQKNQVQKI